MPPLQRQFVRLNKPERLATAQESRLPVVAKRQRYPPRETVSFAFVATMPLTGNVTNGVQSRTNGQRLGRMGARLGRMGTAGVQRLQRCSRSSACYSSPIGHLSLPFAAAGAGPSLLFRGWAVETHRGIDSHLNRLRAQSRQRSIGVCGSGLCRSGLCSGPSAGLATLACAIAGDVGVFGVQHALLAAHDRGPL